MTTNQPVGSLPETCTWMRSPGFNSAHHSSVSLKTWLAQPYAFTSTPRATTSLSLRMRHNGANPGMSGCRTTSQRGCGAWRRSAASPVSAPTTLATAATAVSTRVQLPASTPAASQTSTRHGGGSR